MGLLVSVTQSVQNNELRILIFTTFTIKVAKVNYKN